MAFGCRAIEIKIKFPCVIKRIDTKLSYYSYNVLQKGISRMPLPFFFGEVRPIVAIIKF